MNSQISPRLLAAALCAAVLFTAAPVRAEMSAEELAKLAQNSVGNLISVPFQNNTNLNVGREKGTQNILNIQPVYTIEVNKDWNLITRTIIPLIWQPGSVPGQGTEFGLGDIQLSGFLSPSEPGPGGLIWGVGAIAQMPTDTNDLGNKIWRELADSRAGAADVSQVTPGAMTMIEAHHGVIRIGPGAAR